MLACMQVLGLDRAASWREVKAAYKRLALSLHPDKQRSATPDQAAAVAHKFQEVAEAHDVLTNEDQRAACDKVRDYMVGCDCCCDSKHPRAVVYAHPSVWVLTVICKNANSVAAFLMTS